MVHLYTAAKQPATGFVDRCGEQPIEGGWPPEQKIFCQCCGKKRAAKDCVVQCFDGLRVWCADGKGCKNPQTIAAKRWKQHMARSRSQQARRQREKATRVARIDA